MTSPDEISVLLHEWSEGKREALNQLMPIVYDELHKQAHRYLRKENVGHTLQTTALIHEAYLKLADQRAFNWHDRIHFFAVAANVMRQILVDHARAKHREKRGGNKAKLPIDEAMLVAADEQDVDLLVLDEALTKLAEFDAQAARVVELRYFADLKIEETAEALNISPATVKRDWQAARMWLERELTR